MINIQSIKTRALRLAAMLALCAAPAMVAAQTVPPPPAFPGVNGQHVAAPQVIASSGRIYTYWFLRDKTSGRVVAYGTMCSVAATCGPDLIHSVHTAMLSTTAKVTTARRLWEQNVTWRCTGAEARAAIKTADPVTGVIADERASLCAEWWGLLQINQATWLAGVAP